MSIRLRLLSILPRLVALGYKGLNKLLKQFPEAMHRSTVLVLYDSSGGRIAFWIGTENGKPVVKEVDPEAPPYATTTIRMHIDTFIRILKGKLDFRAAYLYDLVDVESNDGLPASYHFLLWAAFFDHARRLLGGGKK